jgi:hypothetical protein
VCRFRRGFFVARNGGRGRAACLAVYALPYLQRYVVVERAGVRLLVGNAQLGQRLEDHVGLYFELAGQLIDANFTHTITFHLKSRRIFTKVQPLLLRIPEERPELP